MTDEEKPRGPALGALAVRLAAAWILAGGLFKLFLGTPKDIPPSVVGILDDAVLTYKLAIAIEFAVTALAILRPKYGWWLIAGAYAVFEVVLVTQMAAGAESCGCFGSKVPMPPWGMMVIDTVLLVFMLATRPWKLPSTGGPWWLVGALALGGIAMPWIFDREASSPKGLSVDGEGNGGGSPLREFVDFDVDDWTGKSIDETELAEWIEGDIYSLPMDGLWILWRWTCDHCAEHLEHLALNPPDAPTITLIRLKEPHDTEGNRTVFTMPTGDHVFEASCPDTVDYIITTPGELVLEAAVVVRAEEGVSAD